MKLLGLLLAAALLAPTSKPVLRPIEPLTVFGGVPVCTTFSINEKKHYWLTANHCVRKNTLYYVADQAAWVVDRDEDVDLAVLKTDVIAAAVPIADAVPEIGSIGIVIGWPSGHLVPTYGWLMTNDAELEVRNDEGWFHFPHKGHYMLFAMPVYPGHSGSPIFVDGKLVSVAQVGSPSMTGGVQFPVLKKYIARYVK